MRGRKPKPTYLKLLNGNPGKRPVNEHEPKPERVIPPAPEELSAEARVEWDRVASELSRIGTLTLVDRAALAAYSQAYGRWVQAERAIAQMAERDQLTAGLMVRTVNGNAIQNPLLGIATRGMADMVKYAAEFGMTPSSRSRIAATTDPNQSAFDEWDHG